jgi:hypothetical protein
MGLMAQYFYQNIQKENHLTIVVTVVGGYEGFVPSSSVNADSPVAVP